MEALCVGVGRREPDVDAGAGDDDAPVGARELRRSSPYARGFPAADGRCGISPLDVRWWPALCAERGLASDRGSDGALADAGDAGTWDDRRLTRSELPDAGRGLCLPIVGDELCERCGAGRWLLFWLEGRRGPYDCIMNGAEGGRSGIESTPMPMPYIGTCTCIDCSGMPIGIADMGTCGMFMFMFMFHIEGIGGTGTTCECRQEPPLSEAMELRRLWLPLMRRSRCSRIRMSCCDEDGVGTAEYIDGGLEPVPEPEPYTLFGRESAGEPEPEPDADPPPCGLDGLGSASAESEFWRDGDCRGICTAAGSYAAREYDPPNAWGSGRLRSRSHWPVARPSPVMLLLKPSR